MHATFHADWFDAKSLSDGEERIASRFGPNIIAIAMSAKALRLPPFKGDRRKKPTRKDDE
jgi:hypothetical protein